MATTLEKNDTAILSRAIGLENGGLSPDAARSILAMQLSPADRVELQRLAALAKEGTLSSEEEADLENYRHAGRVLELFKSKARISLKRPADAADEPRS